MFKKMIFLFMVLAFTSIYSYSQESCSCSSGGCSASQSCPAGKSAACVCTSAGCSSSCSVTSEVPIDNGGVSRNGSPNARNIGSVLSSLYGVNVQFKQTVKNYTMPESRSFDTKSWNLLDELSRNGELTINGQNVDFWKGVRKTLLEGGEFKICSGGSTAQRLINIVSFISGKKYLITSGDAEAKFTGQISGNNLSEVIQSLQKAGAITVAESN